MQISRTHFGILASPAAVMFILFFLLPVAMILMEAFSDSTAFSRVFNDTLFHRGLIGTLILGIAAATFSVVVGFCVALALSRMKASSKTLLLFVISLPLTFSGLIVAYGFILAFGRAGFITQLFAYLGADPAVIGGFIFSPMGLGFAYSYYLIPRVVMVMMPAVQNFDHVQLSVAQSLGASRIRTLWEIMIPQLIPSFVASFCLTSAVAMGAYGTALALVGTQMNILPLMLYSKVSEGGTDMPAAAAISLILMAICCVVIAVGEVFTNIKTKSDKR